MDYTTQQLARLAGVSPRTLRYYDSIGLLCPARNNQNNYRLYGPAAVARLQQILFYRAMEMPLGEIAAILEAPADQQVAALRHWRQELADRRQRLHLLVETVDEMICEKEEQYTMQDEKRFRAFQKDMIAENRRQYGQEVAEKYGEENLRASEEKLLGLSEEAYRAFESDGKEILQRLEEALAVGADPTASQGQALAALHRRWLGYTWPRYTKQAHQGLVEMYLMDGRFTAYYDDACGQGAARFLRDAVVAWLAL